MEVDPEVSVGAWLSRRRSGLGLTQKEVARHTGCSVSAIRKFETDMRRPSVQIAERLAEVLAIPVAARRPFLQTVRGELRLEAFLAALEAASGSGQGAASPTHTPTLARQSHSVSAPTVPTVGREQELAHLLQLLTDPQCRLLTLTGLGGIGKTHLALQAAHDAERCFAGGACFVSLAPVTDPSHLVPTIARALGVGLHSPSGPERQLSTYLRDKELLLVLDNAEHLLAPALAGSPGPSEGSELGRFLASVIQQAPGVKLLVTSRERLHLHGEWVFELYGLPVPPCDEDELETFSAATLFIQCAKRVDARFDPTEEDRRAIAHICRMLEGMPLAIELAAAWVALLPCAAIAKEIESNLDFLTVMRRDVPPRHRSVRAAFDSSWQLLQPEEQQILSKLAIFRNGFTREAAQAVAGAALPTLRALLAKSLIQRSADRFTLHELLRQYSLEHLQPEASDETWRAFAGYYLALARQAAPEINGPGQLMWLDRLEQELGNLRAVLQWTIETNNLETGLEIAASIQAFWSQRDLHDEGRRWLDALLAHAPAQSSAAATAHLAASFLAYEQNEFAAARQWLDRLLPHLSTYPDPGLQQKVWSQLGAVALAQGEVETARTYLEQSLAWVQRHQPQTIAHAVLLTWMGDLFHLQRAGEQAVAHYAESAALFRQRGSKNHLAYTLRHWSWALIRQGDLAQAARLCQESLLLNEETDSELGVVGCVACTAALHAARQETEQAIQLLAAVDGMLQTLGLLQRPLDQHEYAATLAAVRAQAPPDLFDRAWQQGQQWSRAQVLACIRDAFDG